MPLREQAPYGLQYDGAVGKPQEDTTGQQKFRAVLLPAGASRLARYRREARELMQAREEPLESISTASGIEIHIGK